MLTPGGNEMTVIDLTAGPLVRPGRAGAREPAVDTGTFHVRTSAALSLHRAAGLDMAMVVVGLDPMMRFADGLDDTDARRIVAAFDDRMGKVVYDGDFATRLGATEYAIACQRISGEAEAARIARRLVDVLSAPVGEGTGSLFPSIHAGVVVANGSHRGVDQLLADARAALGWARAYGGERWRLFDGSLRSALRRRTRTESRVRQALDNDEFALFYQPLIGVGDGEPIGVEALLRWNDPARGLVSAGSMVAQAERSDLIARVGRWVLEEAARDSSDESRPILAGLKIHINLSPGELEFTNVAKAFESTLTRHGLEPSALGIEITERMPFEERYLGALRDLRSMGLEISLDDFGTGYSSVQRLADMPIDTLKVDRALVMEVGTSDRASEMLAAIVMLGHAAGLSVLAEGIESAVQLRAVEEAGCDAAQGYYLARPRPRHLVRLELTRWAERADVGE